MLIIYIIYFLMFLSTIFFKRLKADLADSYKNRAANQDCEEGRGRDREAVRKGKSIRQGSTANER